MSWLPENWDVLSIAAVVIAALGGVVGITAGVQGFTATANARRLVLWTSEALDHTHEAGRVATLKEMRSGAEARLLALHLVRWWRFTEAAGYLMFAGPFLFLTFGRATGWFSIISSVLFVAVMIQGSTRRAIRTYCERVRIEHEYVDGSRRVNRPQLGMLSLIEGGTPREWRLSGLAAIEVTAFVAGIALLASGWSTVWGIVLASGGAGGFALWFGEVHEYARTLAAKSTRALSAAQ